MVNCVRCGHKQAEQEIVHIKEKCFNGCAFYEGFKTEMWLHIVQRDDDDDRDNFVANYCPACVMHLAVRYVLRNRAVMFKED